MNLIKIAILDMYAGFPNQGMRNIKEIIELFASDKDFEVSYKVFDLRAKAEVPDLSYHIFISTGGPGSPVESEGSAWENAFFSLIESIKGHNLQAPLEDKKYVFLICHSFQIYCRHYELGTVTKRKSTSFGVMPVHKTKLGLKEPYFQALADPFWAVDSRDWQVTHPDHEKISEQGGSVLAIEKYRPHVDLDRCVMAIRFNEEFFGTQFHPEADPEGILIYLKTDEKKANVIENHGEAKYYAMLEQLNDPDKIVLTYANIIPSFLNDAVDNLILVKK